MKRVVALSVLSLVAAAYAESQTSTTNTRTRHNHGSGPSSTPIKKSSAATRKHTAVASTRDAPRASPGTAGVRTGTGIRSRRGKGRRTLVKAGPSYQLHPDAGRYQQIQQALADKGYYKGPVNGEWGDDSVAALKKFQADRKIEDDGKINSLSLIGLGLGPKHDGNSGLIGPASPPGVDPPDSMPPPPAEPQSATAIPPE